MGAAQRSAGFDCSCRTLASPAANGLPNAAILVQRIFGGWQRLLRVASAMQ